MGNRTSSDSSYTLNPASPKTPLFTNTIYRIPSLLYIKDDQTFLAFAEKRTSPADVDATVLVMRRGTKQNGAIQELTTASLEGYRTMNPCPVYEKNSKTVFLFFNCVFDKVTEQEQIHNRKNRARLCYVTSQDSGKSWSITTDLTESVIGKEIKKWATFSVGPGHGIQMCNGRLIIPAYVYYIVSCCTCCCICSSCCCSVKPYAFAFYSDDQGVTWHFGQRVSVESAECEMAEITDSNGKSYLYCNARSSKKSRVEARSQNGGEDFSVNSTGKLVETPGGCQGSVVSFAHDEKTWLLFSHITDKNERKDLGVYLNKSPFSANGWNKPSIINPGVSGYSDMTQCDSNDRFACLMERGTNKLEEIAFTEFSLNDIMKDQ
ncbi:sialidase-3-like [Pangasianodon hypophthalmus]|uniref:sialidase-3-like n=1 Tax=Pangasianodon hypophthalmus TaxID=310915 RepID=UPI002306EA8F|nr:sialidase-3-like [Pangasianodon hypophthalmus]